MDKINEIVYSLPPMLTGTELTSALTVLPDYDESVRNECDAVRLMALSDLEKIYLPSMMSCEIYSKLYLSLIRSLQKKQTRLAIRQRYENNHAIQQQAYNGILGGSDSYTIIAPSGVGKSSAINRVVSLITENRMIETHEPFSRIIPCLVVQCPFDASTKGLMLEILRNVDEELETKYYHHAVRSRAMTTDVLIGTVATVALNHIGLLIVDEVQNVTTSKNGRSLIGALTQIINCSGISICMVGMPECTSFFEQAVQLARRSLGLQYGTLEYDDYFCRFCETVFVYQYVRERTEITPAITEWLYEHSGGVISVVISLIRDAQELAILTGSETLDLEMLKEAYKKRLSMMHGYIEPGITRRQQCGTPQKKRKTTTSGRDNEHTENEQVSIGELAGKARGCKLDIVELLRQHMPVEEVAVC